MRELDLHAGEEASDSINYRFDLIPCSLNGCNDGPGCFFINRQSKVKIGSYSHVFNSEDTFMERRGVATVTGNTL